MNPVHLLRELVAVDSTSHRTNAPMIDLLEAKLVGLGLSTARHGYVDAAGVAKQNLIARAGGGAGLGEPPVALALVGHTDCVPFDPAWTAALTLTARDGKLYGRGACDTKGFIACALSAVSGVALSKLTRPLALVFTADEEVGCVGAKALADAGLLRVQNAIVGEPTKLQPIRANKGYCLGQVVIEGREAHSAYPSEGASAIRAAGRFLAALDGLDAELRALPDPAFEPPFTTTNVGLIEGGKAKNIIAGRCALTLEWRPLPGQDPARVAERVREILAQVTAAEPGLSFQFEPGRLDRGFATPPESALLRFMARATGRSPGTVAFGTEGPQLCEMGAEVVVFGPGDITVAHRTGEFVPEADLAACTAVLGQAIAQFCG